MGSIRYAGHQYHSSNRSVGWALAAFGLALSVGISGAGCQLDSGQRKGDPTLEDQNPSNRLQTLVGEAEALDSDISAAIKKAAGVEKDAGDRAERFATASSEIQAKALNLKAIREVLKTCWTRAQSEDTCSPPERANRAARKVGKTTSQPTLTFLEGKLEQIELLREVLYSRMPAAADEVADAAKEVKAKLARVRGDFDSELARMGDKAANFDDESKQMQELGARIERKVADGEALAAKLRSGRDALVNGTTMAIDTDFDLSAKGKKR